MTPLQASVLLNEAIELLEQHEPYDQGDCETDVSEALDRLRSFRDGFFRHIRIKNNHPVKVPAVPEKVKRAAKIKGPFEFAAWSKDEQQRAGPSKLVIGVDPATSDAEGCVVIGRKTPDGVLMIDEVIHHQVKVPAVPAPSREHISVHRPVFNHTRPEGLGVLAQPKFQYGRIPSEHKCEHCREYDLDGCPNCPGFEGY